MRLLDQVGARQLPQLRRALLAWYDRNRRDLPWRRTKDPYRIWISEVMLQQTRVAAVLPRYEIFIQRFPSVQNLAAAKLASVLAEWSGLGYYRRARNLHAAAQAIVRSYGSRFPPNAAGLCQLPGIGRYSAAAIASIAFDEPVAVLDGNVERVLRRLLGRNLPKSESWNAAQQLLDRKRPGDFNQAIMELGATVCLPVEPSCVRCPIIRSCRTRGRGEPPKRKPRQRKAALVYALALRPTAVYLIQRPSIERLMPGMWELPGTDPVERAEVLFTIRHSITVTNYAVAVIARRPEDVIGGKWVRIADLQRLPLTGLAKKILRKAKIIQ